MKDGKVWKVSRISSTTFARLGPAAARIPTIDPTMTQTIIAKLTM